MLGLSSLFYDVGERGAKKKRGKRWEQKEKNKDLEAEKQ
jgi:hypothetical protein